jgi:hypothetical protein
MRDGVLLPQCKELRRDGSAQFVIDGYRSGLFAGITTVFEASGGSSGRVPLSSANVQMTYFPFFDMS